MDFYCLCLERKVQICDIDAEGNVFSWQIDCPYTHDNDDDEVECRLREGEMCPAYVGIVER